MLVLISLHSTVALLMPAHFASSLHQPSAVLMRPSAGSVFQDTRLLNIFPAQLIAEGGGAEGMSVGKAKIEAAKRASDEKVSKRGYTAPEARAVKINFDTDKELPSETPQAPTQNEAEAKLQQLLAKKLVEREAMLGFKLDADDIQIIEETLRNKYCGKAGLLSSLDGGPCSENTYGANVYCSKDRRFSSSASCGKEYNQAGFKPGDEFQLKMPSL